MFKKMLLVLTSIGVVGALTVYLLTIPLLRLLPKQGRVSSETKNAMFVLAPSIIRLGRPNLRYFHGF